MANYIPYIPLVGQTDYPTKISNFITLLSTDVTNLETTTTTITNTRLPLKADRVLTANTTGKIPSLTANGNLQDSGLLVTNLATMNTTIPNGIVAQGSGSKNIVTTSILSINLVTASNNMTSNNLVVADGFKGLSGTGIPSANVVTSANNITANNIPISNGNKTLTDSTLSINSIARSNTNLSNLNLVVCTDRVLSNSTIQFSDLGLKNVTQKWTAQQGYNIANLESPWAWNLNTSPVAYLNKGGSNIVMPNPTNVSPGNTYTLTIYTTGGTVTFGSFYKWSSNIPMQYLGAGYYIISIYAVGTQYLICNWAGPYQ